MASGGADDQRTHRPDRAGPRRLCDRGNFLQLVGDDDAPLKLALVTSRASYHPGHVAEAPASRWRDWLGEAVVARCPSSPQPASTARLQSRARVCRRSRVGWRCVCRGFDLSCVALFFSTFWDDIRTRCARAG